MFLGCRGAGERLSVVATSMTVKPPYICGTDRCCLGHHTQIKTGQAGGKPWTFTPGSRGCVKEPATNSRPGTLEHLDGKRCAVPPIEAPVHVAASPRDFTRVDGYDVS